MSDDVFLSGFEQSARFELWILWIKLVATGITAALLVLLAVFTVSVRRHGGVEYRIAGYFTVASLFATAYIGADAAVRVSVALGDVDDVLVPYRLALSAIVLSVGAYLNLYWVLDPRRSARAGAVATGYAASAAAIALIWVNNPFLIIASGSVSVNGTGVYADYGAAAPAFFALCLGSFSAVCVCLIRLARRMGTTMIRRLTVLGFLVLLATGVHDVLRELNIVAFRVGMLPIGYALFQIGAFAVLAIHYSRTLELRRDQGRELRRLTDAVARDDHSGLFTRSYLEDTMNQLGPALPGGLLFIDLDHFKRVNDRFGHACGDELIRAVAQRLRTNVRDGDIACRWGGDEFVVYLPGTDTESLRALTDRLQQAFRTIRLAPAAEVGVGVSMGFAELSGGDWRDALARADRAMYEAKRAGRNQVISAA